MASTSDGTSTDTGSRAPVGTGREGRGGRSRHGTLLVLHLLLMVYSTNSILSKLAARQEFLSLGFILLYGGVIALLGTYAIGWQQVIKRLPLTTAYANKAVTLVWGIVWGALVFHESVTPLKLLGAAIVLAGVVLYSLADGAEADAAPGVGGADGVAGKAAVRAPGAEEGDAA